MISIILKALFPGHIESLDPNAGVGYEIIGDLHQGLIDRYDHIKWLALTQEFGTFNMMIDPFRFYRLQGLKTDGHSGANT